MYESIRILDIITKANDGRICLPSIQRPFIWKMSQIEKLFDSIYRGYPFGTFLLWDINSDDINKYAFYSFIRDFNEKDNYFSEKVARPVPRTNIEAFLDGQQRITSLIIALQGSYSSEQKNSKKAGIIRTIKRKLYFNLLSFNTNVHDNPDNDDFVLFKMLSDNELNTLNSKNSTVQFWHPVSDCIDNKWNCDIYSDSFRKNIKDLIERYSDNDYIKSLNEDSYLDFTRCLAKLIARIRNENLITYFKVKNNSDLDEACEIFVRVNDGGTKLSKTDFLFSTIISSWEVGRDIVQQLIKDVKEIGYIIDTDFVMRTCLYLTNHDILFKVRTFIDNDGVIKDIIKQFENNESIIDIKRSIINTFVLLRNELGISDKTLKSINVIIPVIYHLYLSKSIRDNSLKEIKKYIFVSLLNNIFSSHGDSLLRQIRNAQNDPEYGESFDFSKTISQIEKNKLRQYEINIDEYLTKKKGGDGWNVLSLIYPVLPHYLSNYDQDHLFASSLFMERNYTPEDWEFIKLTKDTVPNLAFLKPEENQAIKRDLTLEKYLSNKTPAEKVFFNNFNFIPEDCDLSLSNFKEFYNRRRETLKGILKRELNVSDDNIHLIQDPAIDFQEDESELAELEFIQQTESNAFVSSAKIYNDYVSYRNKQLETIDVFENIKKSKDDPDEPLKILTFNDLYNDFKPKYIVYGLWQSVVDSKVKDNFTACYIEFMKYMLWCNKDKPSFHEKAVDRIYIRRGNPLIAENKDDFFEHEGYLFQIKTKLEMAFDMNEIVTIFPSNLWLIC